MRVRAAALAALLAGALVPAAAHGDELLGTCGSELCVAAPGGAPTPITGDGAGPEGGYSSVAVSADGQRMTYVRPAGLWRAGARNAAPERLLEIEAGDGRESAISADGQSFAFRTFDGSFNGFESNLRIGGAIGSFLWSSSGSVVLASFAGNDLLITRPAEGQPNDVACRAARIPDGPPPCGQIVAADPTRDVQGNATSPDGRLLAAEAQTDGVSEIALFDTATGALVRNLTTGGQDYAPAFSPDGARVAFTRGSDTLVVPVAGGEPAVLVAGMSGASWYEPPRPQAPTQPPPTGPGNPAPPGTTPGRPSAPAGTLRVRRGRVAIEVRCRAAAGCTRTRWTFKQARRVRLRVTVPALRAGQRRTLRVRVPRATVRRIGRKGLKLRLTGRGLKPRTVTLVRR